MKLVPISILAILVFATGCRTATQIVQQRTSHDVLRDARKALVAGQTVVADQRVEEARRLAKDEGSDVSDVDLLAAEVQLRKNDAASAASKARSVLARNPDNPRANEVLGKALLQTGSFNDAESHLQAAKSGYSAPVDQRRIEDLISVVRGLAAHAKGDLPVARQYWASIKDSDLRHSLDQVARDIAHNGVASN